MRLLFSALSLLVALGCGTSTAVAQSSARPIVTGAEVLLRDSLHLVRGRRVGLITNPTAVTAASVHTIDLLNAHPDIDLVALFGPEHGLRGGVDAGVHIANARDPETGIPVRSLYGRTLQPTREMLADVEVLVFDMLDISARTYTYIWTMTLAMEAAAESHIPFIVLDRPNPVKGMAGGPLASLDGLRTGPRITGHYPVPFRHGMTPGEIARYVNAEYDLGVDLTVVPVEGWRRDSWFDETGLPWVDPSPNIRTLEAALNFTGLGPLEATALSLGRGTPAPFSFIGAPWLDVPALIRRVEAHRLPGVRLVETSVTPSGEGWMQFRGERIPAAQIVVTDRDAYDPSVLGLALLTEIYRLHPSRLGMRSMRHVLDDQTTDEIRDGATVEQIAARWSAEGQAWARRTAPYLLYD